MTALDLEASMYHIKLEYPLELGVTSGYSGGYVSFTTSNMSDMYALIEHLSESLRKEEYRLSFPKKGV